MTFKIIRPLTINDAALTSSNVLENDYATYSAGTTYALGAHVIVVSTDVHKVYESLQAGNLGHTPATSPTWWLDLGATNRWKMFDQSVNSQTSNADSVDVVLQVPAGQRVNGLTLLNLSATSARVTMTDATDGVVYDQTHSLVSSSGITDWYAYFFEPIVRLSDLAVLDMPPYAAPTMQVTLSAAGETVLCGALLLGLQVNVGGTQYGAGIGIQDYSIKDQDAFGNYSIVERAYRKRAVFSVWIASGMVDQLQILLASYRALPIVYIGSSEYSATIIYGFYKDFNIEIAYATESICSIELEGLT